MNEFATYGRAVTVLNILARRISALRAHGFDYGELPDANYAPMPSVAEPSGDGATDMLNDFDYLRDTISEVAMLKPALGVGGWPEKANNLRLLTGLLSYEYGVAMLTQEQACMERLHAALVDAVATVGKHCGADEDPQVLLRGAVRTGMSKSGDPNRYLSLAFNRHAATAQSMRVFLRAKGEEPPTGQILPRP